MRMKKVLSMIIMMSLCLIVVAFDVPKEDSEEFLRYLELRDNGNPSAVELLMSLRETYPDNLFLNKEWLEVQFRYRRFEEALHVANDILKKNPRDIDTLLKKADLVERIEKKFPEKIYQSILKIDDHHTFSMVRLAEYYFSKNKPQKSLEMYTRIYEIVGSNQQIEHKLIVLHYKLKKYIGIFALHVRKLKLSEDTQQLWDTFFEIVYTEKNFTAIEQLIRNLRYADDKTMHARFYFILCMMKARDGSLTDYEHNLRKKKILPDGEWQFYFASYYLENGINEDDDRALPLLEEILRNDPHNKDALKYMVQYHIAKNDVQGVSEWLQAYKKSTKDFSLDITALYLISQKNEENARKVSGEYNWNDYEEKLLLELIYTLQAVKKNELAYYFGQKIQEVRFAANGPFDFWYIMMQIASSRNDESAMTRYYEKSIVLKPDEPYLLNYYAFSLLIMNVKINEAVTLLEKAHSLAPDDGAIRDSLGWGYFLQGKIKKAHELIDSALTRISDDPEVLYHKAKILCKEGKIEEALKYFKLAQENDKEKRLDYVQIEKDIIDCTPRER